TAARAHAQSPAGASSSGRRSAGGRSMAEAVAAGVDTMGFTKTVSDFTGDTANRRDVLARSLLRDLGVLRSECFELNPIARYTAASEGTGDTGFFGAGAATCGAAARNSAASRTVRKKNPIEMYPSACMPARWPSGARVTNSPESRVAPALAA